MTFSQRVHHRWICADRVGPMEIQSQLGTFVVSLDSERGQLIPTPPIELGGIRILGSRVTYVDVKIFKQWKLTTEPAVLIGMDVLGLLDTLIIDYRRHELQLRMDAEH